MAIQTRAALHPKPRALMADRSLAARVQDVAARALVADRSLAAWLNAAAGGSAVLGLGASRAAVWLASVEVVLMLGLGLTSGFRVAARMLAGVGVVYLASEALGVTWPRQRPFARLAEVDALVPHAPQRSFPSRHVASGIAMAAIARRTAPRTARVMSSVAWLLGTSRVAAGLHYPSDVLAGALLGAAVGWLLH